MTTVDVAVGALLAAGCGLVLLSLIGVSCARNFYERIHYLGPASTLGISLIAAAVVVRESLNQAGIKAVLTALVTIIASAVASHAIARAGRIERRGSVRILPEEEQRRVD